MIALFVFFFSSNACTIYPFKVCPPTTYHVYSMLVDYSLISHFPALKCLHRVSQGGITISKRRSRLKGNIVEALQCVKCAIRHDLLFREPPPSSILEAEETSDHELDVGVGGELGESGEESDLEDLSWDGLLNEDEDDEAMYYSE